MHSYLLASGPYCVTASLNEFCWLVSRSKSFPRPYGLFRIPVSFSPPHHFFFSQLPINLLLVCAKTCVTKLEFLLSCWLGFSMLWTLDIFSLDFISLKGLKLTATALITLYAGHAFERKDPDKFWSLYLKKWVGLAIHISKASLSIFCFSVEQIIHSDVSHYLQSPLRFQFTFEEENLGGRRRKELDAGCFLSACRTCGWIGFGFGSLCGILVFSMSVYLCFVVLK